MANGELKGKVEAEMKAALRAGAKQRLGALRLILADIKQVEVDERTELDDARIVAILDRMAKQRRDSLAQYEQAERQDLAEQERFELAVLAEFLPAQLDDAEIDKLIAECIAECGAETMREMGAVMGALKPKLQGRADMGSVSQKVKARLS